MLRAIVACYAGDPRVSAVVVFGSLGRGTWDSLSDIDLDADCLSTFAFDLVNDWRGIR